MVYLHSRGDQAASGTLTVERGEVESQIIESGPDISSH